MVQIIHQGIMNYHIATDKKYRMNYNIGRQDILLAFCIKCTS